MALLFWVCAKFKRPAWWLSRLCCHARRAGEAPTWWQTTGGQSVHVKEKWQPEPKPEEEGGPLGCSSPRGAPSWILPQVNPSTSHMEQKNCPAEPGCPADVWRESVVFKLINLKCLHYSVWYFLSHFMSSSWMRRRSQAREDLGEEQPGARAEQTAVPGSWGWEDSGVCEASRWGVEREGKAGMKSGLTPHSAGTSAERRKDGLEDLQWTVHPAGPWLPHPFFVIQVRFTLYKINLFKGNDSVTSRTFTILCTHHLHLQKISITPEGNPVLIMHVPHIFPSPQPLAITSLHSVFMDLSLIDISHKLNHVVCGLLCRASLTQQKVVKVHLCCSSCPYLFLFLWFNNILLYIYTTIRFAIHPFAHHFGSVIPSIALL